MSVDRAMHALGNLKRLLDRLPAVPGGPPPARVGGRAWRPARPVPPGLPPGPFARFWRRLRRVYGGA